MAVTKTWVNDGITDAYFGMDGYELMLRRDREDTGSGRGGGIMVQVKVGVKISQSFDLKYTLFNQCVKYSLPSPRVKGRIPVSVIVS